MLPFSVIVPVYNVEKFLPKCLDSILGQTFPDFEVICVDDRGSDGSREIAERYARLDPRVRIVEHQANFGLGQSRNTGMAHASGEYLLFIDSDDWVLPSLLERANEVVRKSDFNSIWFKFSQYFEDSREYLIQSWYEYFMNQKGGAFTVPRSMILQLPVMAWNKVYKRQFLMEMEYEWPAGIYHEDLPFHFLFCLDSPQTYIIDEILYVYRQHGGSITQSPSLKKRRVDGHLAGVKFIFDFLKKRGEAAFAAHAEDFLTAVMSLIGGCSDLCDGQREYVLSSAAALLKNIGFPDLYPGYENYPFLVALRSYKSSLFSFVSETRRIKLAAMANRFCPFPGVRRKNRKRLKSRKSVRKILEDFGHGKEPEYRRHPQIDALFSGDEVT